MAPVTTLKRAFSARRLLSALYAPAFCLGLSLSLSLGPASNPAQAVPSDYGPLPGLDVEAIMDYGRGLYEAGFFRQAIAEFQEILQADETHANANYMTGLSHMGLDEVPEAIPYLEAALQSYPQLYGAREQLGLAWLQQGDVAAARAQLDILDTHYEACEAECDPQLSTARESLRSAIEHHGTEQDLGSLWQQPEHQRALQDSIARIHRADYPRAIELLESTLAIAGPHPDLLNYLGYTYRKSGQYEQAITYYRQALTINPSHLGANEYLGELYVELGDLDRARLQLAKLDSLCAFGCYEHDELARWIHEAESKVKGKEKGKEKGKVDLASQALLIPQVQ